MQFLLRPSLKTSSPVPCLEFFTVQNSDTGSRKQGEHNTKTLGWGNKGDSQ